MLLPLCCGWLSISFSVLKVKREWAEKKDENFGETGGLGGERCVSGTRGGGKVATSDKSMACQFSCKLQKEQKSLIPLRSDLRAAKAILLYNPLEEEIIEKKFPCR